MDNPFLTALYPCRLTKMQNHSDNKLCAINIMPICHMCSSSAIRKNILDKNRTILHCYFLFVSNVLYFIFVSVAEKGVILNIWKILQSWQKIKKQMELCACFVRQPRHSQLLIHIFTIIYPLKKPIYYHQHLSIIDDIYRVL